MKSADTDLSASGTQSKVWCREPWKQSRKGLNFNFGKFSHRHSKLFETQDPGSLVFSLHAHVAMAAEVAEHGGGGGTGGQPFPQLQQTFEQIGQWISDNPWIVAVFILLILVFVVLALFLGTIGRVGLIRGTYQAEQGAARLVFGELFSESMPYFWRVFGLSF
jgi:hypothetical protein